MDLVQWFGARSQGNTRVFMKIKFVLPAQSSSSVVIRHGRFSTPGRTIGSPKSGSAISQLPVLFLAALRAYPISDFTGITSVDRKPHFGLYDSTSGRPRRVTMASGRRKTVSTAW